jgi:predicted methyltransferase
LPAAVRDVIDAADRNPQDRELDAGRHPGEMLAFYGIAGGMRVAELMAGGGYTAELLARTVGPEGKVYGQNNAFMLERFAQAPWTERLTKEVNKNIVRLDRELESPLPEDARDLDAVFLVLFYHDSVWMKTDRAKMNAAIFAALKSGGVYAVIDHSASDGAGVEHAKTLHRIEEKVVREEVAAAGFKLAGEASFLRNPADPRDWSASPSTAGERRGTSDRFVLKFVKP